jgi:multiple sugar transport system permease protein
MFTRPIPILPPELTLENFIDLFRNTQFTRYYINSTILSAGVVTITTILATLGGYGLTRMEIPYKKSFARGILFGYMFPPILLAIPMFILWRQLGILNTYLGVILAVTAISLPFGLWLMWKFFQTVPESLEESAKMSGATQFQAFYEIALPLATPGSIAVAVYSYAVAWNAYTIPRVLLSDEALWPLTVGIDTFTRQQNVLWGQIMGASALAIIPAFLFVYFLQKYLLRGFRTAGVG